MGLLDTSADADTRLTELLRAAGEAGRFRMALSLSEDVRKLTRLGIQLRHPEYSAELVEQALRRMLLGDQLFQAVWPGVPLRDP